jgi:hypothetical protein
MQNFALPKLGDRDVADIRAAEVVEVLRPIWTTKPETARRVLQRVKAVFGWGLEQFERPGTQVILFPPAYKSGKLQYPLPE